jgi:hypothetical protein
MHDADDVPEPIGPLMIYTHEQSMRSAANVATVRLTCSPTMTVELNASFAHIRDVEGREG